MGDVRSRTEQRIDDCLLEERHPDNHLDAEKLHGALRGYRRKAEQKAMRFPRGGGGGGGGCCQYDFVDAEVLLPDMVNGRGTAHQRHHKVPRSPPGGP